MDMPKVDPKDLKWNVVADAAARLTTIATRDVMFRAPEEMNIDLKNAVEQVNRIAEALCLVPERR